MKACYLMTNMESTNSYRGELEGAYRALYHIDYLGMEPRGKFSLNGLIINPELTSEETSRDGERQNATRGRFIYGVSSSERETIMRSAK